MFYEQCLGRGTMHDSIRENFNWIFCKDSGNYDSYLHDDYIDDHKNTGFVTIFNRVGPLF